MVAHTIAEHLPHLPSVGWYGALLTLVLLGGYLLKIVRALVRVTRRANGYFDDWNGEPERPGYPARPGIPERLANVEAQLQTNGGLSIKDQMNRIERKLEAHIADTLESHG